MWDCRLNLTWETPTGHTHKLLVNQSQAGTIEISVSDEDGTKVRWDRVPGWVKDAALAVVERAVEGE